MLRSFHFTATYTTGNTFDVAVAGPSTVTLRRTYRTYAYTVVVVDGREYSRSEGANPLSSAQPAGADPGRWLLVPPNIEMIVATDLADISRDADCLLGSHGPLSREPTAEWQGRRVAVITDTGGARNALPARRYVAAEGQPLLLRLAQTAPLSRDQGSSCARFFGLESSPPSGLVDLVFDSFDKVPRPTAPPDAVDQRTP